MAADLKLPVASGTREVVPQVVEAIADDMANRAEAHRRAADVCGCRQPQHHHQLAEELDHIAQQYRALAETARDAGTSPTQRGATK